MMKNDDKNNGQESSKKELSHSARETVHSSVPLSELPDLEQIRQHLLALEELLYGRISHYEAEYGIIVERIDLERYDHRLGDRDPRLTGVRVHAEICNEK
jgi:hypothetical protein